MDSDEMADRRLECSASMLRRMDHEWQRRDDLTGAQLGAGAADVSVAAGGWLALDEARRLFARAGRSFFSSCDLLGPTVADTSSGNTDTTGDAGSRQAATVVTAGAVHSCSTALSSTAGDGNASTGCCSSTGSASTAGSTAARSSTRAAATCTALSSSCTSQLGAVSAAVEALADVVCSVGSCD